MSVKNLILSAAGAGGGVNPNAWDISKAYYDPGGANINNSIYNGNFFSIAAQEGVPQGVFFKPDGTKMYIVGTSNDTVYEYTLSTPWLVSTASYVQSFSVALQAGGPRDLFFKPDGTKFYVIDSNNDAVYEYSLGTAWNISTASYVQSFSVSAQDLAPTGLFFKPDGTKMYVLGESGDDVNEYSLSSAWDVSTASYIQNFSVSTQGNDPRSISFTSDGTRMYVLDGTGGGVDVNQYNLSTAWDVSSATYNSNFSVTAQDATPEGLFVDSTGSIFFMIGRTSDVVWQYTIGGFSVAAQETSIFYSMVFKPDGAKMYVIGGTDTVYEYDLSTNWDITTANYLQSFSVAAKDTNPYGLWFKPDGTKMYICGTSSDSVHEYDLSVAWDVTSASFLRTKSISAQDTTPLCIYFREDGLKFYVTGNVGQDVNEYTLSSAWDISTMSFVQSFSIASQTTAPRGIFFKPDGTKMYVVGTSTLNNVNEYDLATAWDISTASFVQTLTTQASGGISVFGIFFKPDGSQFWMASGQISKVLSYLISEE